MTKLCSEPTCKQLRRLDLLLPPKQYCKRAWGRNFLCRPFVPVAHAHSHRSLRTLARCEAIPLGCHSAVLPFASPCSSTCCPYPDSARAPRLPEGCEVVRLYTFTRRFYFSGQGAVSVWGRAGIKSARLRRLPCRICTHCLVHCFSWALFFCAEATMYMKKWSSSFSSYMKSFSSQKKKKKNFNRLFAILTLRMVSWCVLSLRCVV